MQKSYKSNSKLSKPPTESQQILQNQQGSIQDLSVVRNQPDLSSQYRITVKGNNQNSALMSEFHQQYRNQQNQNTRFIEFSNAWKSQTGFGIIMIEKVSMIVNNYFKIVTEMDKRNQEVDILIVYNRQLMEILTKFQDHQKKLLNKLKILQQFNVKIMKQLCNIKNRPFKHPQIRHDQSIFIKFSINDFKFEQSKKNSQQFDGNINKKLEYLFKKYLLPQKFNFYQKIQQIIKQKQTSSINPTQSHLFKKQKLQNLYLLRQQIITYNEQIKDVQFQNIFDLYYKKMEIQKQFKEICQNNQNLSSTSTTEQQNLFAMQVAKIYTELTNMNQQQIQTCLKMQRQARKKLRRLRMKQQQKFLRTCQLIQSENNQLNKDILKQKQRINTLQNQLSIIKADIDYKKMKIKPMSNANNNNTNTNANRSSFMIQQSFMIDDRDLNLSKKMSKQTQKTMTENLKKLKEDNQKLQETLADYKIKQMSKTLILPKIKDKAQKMGIIFQQNWDQIKIIENLLTRLRDCNKGNNKQYKSIQLHREDEILSPHLQNFYDFSANQQQYLKTIPEKSQLDLQTLEALIKELQKENKSLRQKNQQSKSLLIANREDLKKALEQHQATLKQKNSKINQLVKEYEGYQKQIKDLKLQSQFYRQKSQIAQKLYFNLTKALQQLKLLYNAPDQNQIEIQIFSQINKKFKKIRQDIQKQIRRSQQDFQQRKHVNIARDDQISSKHGNNGQDASLMSLKSILIKTKQKRQSDLTQGRDDQYKKNKVKQVNSLGSQQFLQRQLQKQLSLKKYSSKKSEQGQLNQSRQKSSFLKRQRQQNRNGSKKTQPKNDTKNQIKIDQKIQKSEKSQKSQKMSQKIQQECSFQSQIPQSYNKNKLQKKSSTQLGLLKVQPENAQKLTRTQQNQLTVLSKQKNISVTDSKNESSANKNSSSNKDDFQNGDFLHQVYLRQDNTDSVSQIPKQTKKQFEKDNTKKQSPQKNKVKLEASLKGSVNLQILTRSRQNRLSMNDQKPIKKSIKQKKQQKKQQKQLQTFKKQSTQQNKKQTINIQKKQQNKLVVSQPIKQQNLVQSQAIKLFIDQSQNTQNNQIVQPIIRIKAAQPPKQKQQKMLQNSITQKNQRDSIKSIKSNQSQNNERDQYVSLNYSKDAQTIKSRINQRQQQICSNNNNSNYNFNSNYNSNYNYPYPSNNTSSLNPIQGLQQQQRSLLGVHQQYQRIIARISKLGDLQDVLDFAQLYARYKQAVRCLDEAQTKMKRYQIKYRRFQQDLKNKIVTQGLDVNEQLFYLKNLVEQQRRQKQESDKKFEELMKKHIILSNRLINQHIKFMRENKRAEQSKQKQQRKRFL